MGGISSLQGFQAPGAAASGGTLSSFLNQLQSGQYVYGDAGAARDRGDITPEEHAIFTKAFNEYTGTAPGQRPYSVGQTVAPSSPSTSGFSFSEGTTVYTGYDPATDSFTGSLGGIAGNIPISVPRSEASPELLRAFEQYQGSTAGNTVRTQEFIDANQNGIDDRDESQGAPPLTVDEPPASDFVFSPQIGRTEARMDPIQQQLLFGLGGEGGFIPGAMRAAERVFFDEQGRARVIPQEIAGFSPDQVRAFELARQVSGTQDPFIRQAQRQYQSGISGLAASQRQQLAAQRRALQAIQSGAATEQQLREAGLGDILSGIEFGREQALGSEAQLARSLGQLGQEQRAATDIFGREVTAAERAAQQAAGQFGQALRGVERIGGRVYDEFGRDITESMGIAEQAAGQFGRGLGEVEDIARGAAGQFGQGIGAATQALRGGIGALERGIGQELGMAGAATGRFGQGLTDVQRRAQQAAGQFGGALGESAGLIRGTTGAFDPFMTSQFYDPFEERVVQQTMQDILERGAQQDIAARAGDIARGGESAFGSRARLGAEERQRALGRGLTEALAGIRSGGFQQAQQAAMGEFARQREAERAAASGLAGLAGQQLGAQERLASTLGQTEAQRLAAEAAQAGRLGAAGAQQFGAQQALAGQLGSEAQQRLAAQQGLAAQLGQTAAQRLGAQQQLAGMASTAAQQRLAAGQGYGQLLQSTAGQQLAAQQGLAQQMGQAAQQRLGAQQQLGGVLGQQAGQLYGAGTQLGQTVTGLGLLGQQARTGAGQAALGTAGQLAGAQQGLGGVYGQQGAQQLGAQAGYGGFLSGLGQQAQAGQLTGIQALGSAGALQQQQQQSILDAQRQAAMQAQAAPLAQYQALQPFVSMVPAGLGTRIDTQFTQAPSPLQAGIGAGLSTLGALGNFFNPQRT